MKCMDCGGDMTSTVREHLYRESGLDTVVLDKIEVRRCSECSGEEIVIPRLEELHQLIAGAIVAKAARLTPREIRFLRKTLGLSGDDFAERMSVPHETVQGWESVENPTPMPLVNDLRLRLMVLAGQPRRDYPAASVERAGADDPAPLKLRARPNGDHWSSCPA